MEGEGLSAVESVALVFHVWDSLWIWGKGLGVFDACVRAGGGARPWALGEVRGKPSPSPHLEFSWERAEILGDTRSPDLFFCIGTWLNVYEGLALP